MSVKRWEFPRFLKTRIMPFKIIYTDRKIYPVLYKHFPFNTNSGAEYVNLFLDNQKTF